MSFLQPWLLFALPLILLPIIIHLINQWRYQTRRWGAMMFLLAANRMARGYARLRQWLILAMRTLAIAGLIFAVSRPLASGLLGWSGGNRPDTTILLVDRSPSMQQSNVAGQSKFDTGRRQLADALRTLGSTQWVLIDSATMKPMTFESVDALVDSPAMQASSNTADIPGMLQSAMEYLQNNQPGATEIWICSDLRSADWNANSGNWAVIRDAFSQMPQSVRFHLLAYPDSESSNVSVRVTDVRRSRGPDGNVVLLSMQFSRAGDALPPQTMPVQIEINGARTEVNVEVKGSQVELRDHRVSLSGNQERGWGRVSIPADANNADNEFYFVFDDPPPKRVVLVSDDRATTRAVEIAAAVAADGTTTTQVEFVTPDALDSLVLDDTALLLWQTHLPDRETSGMVRQYIGRGGQVIFFPPDGLATGVGVSSAGDFMGARWGEWVNPTDERMIENWRGDEDLLAATRSGAGLPVGQLKFKGYAKMDGEMTRLATIAGGDPLLARVATPTGGVYFCAASPSSEQSNLASNGIVLYAMIRRAIGQGLAALGRTTQRVAGQIDEPTTVWRQVAGPSNVLSTEYAYQSGVYRMDDRSLAVNRSLSEDQRDTIEDVRLDKLFAGLDFSRVDDSAGSMAGIVREIWRIFLFAMIAAMLIEAVLCMPRRRVPQTAVAGVSSLPNASLQKGEAA